MAVVETVKIEGDASGLETTLEKLNATVDKLAGSIDKVQTESKQGFDSISKSVKNVEKQADRT